MNDLRTLLHENNSSSSTPIPTSLVDDDLARGRAALHRRRARRSVRAGLVGVAAAGVIAFAIQGAVPNGARTTATPPATSTTLGAVTLVDYTAEQPAGFTIDKVPAGWAVQDSKTYQLLLAPVGTKNDDTNNFADKIIIELSDQATGVNPIDVSVGAVTGTIYSMTDVDAKGNPIVGNVKTLYVKQPSGAYLAIQIWDASTWTNKQIAQFGAGIHPTGDATKTVG